MPFIVIPLILIFAALITNICTICNNTEDSPKFRKILINKNKKGYTIHDNKMELIQKGYNKISTSEHKFIENNMIYYPELSDNVNEECSICLHKMEVDTIELGCKHKFHRQCVITWFIRGNSTCPKCRADSEGATLSLSYILK
jgi:hypothetical protein